MKADECAAEITSWIHSGINAFIPSKRFQVKPHSSPWFTPACAAAIAHRNHYFHIFHRDNSNENKHNYTDARNNCRRVLREAKNRYADLTKERITSQKLGSKDFWKIYNSVFNKGKSTVPPLIHEDDVLTTAVDKAELLAQKFSSNSNLVSDNPLPEFPSRCDTTLSNLKVTPSCVSKVISHLDPSKSCGPDNIPVIVLQRCAPELSAVLSKLFNKCISESCFPSCWKTASVVPIFKNQGDRASPLNYRPISLLNIISKVFESLINKSLVSHLESNGLFSDAQYGFRSKRSTADLLTVITERISASLDKKGEARLVALDISKAFDRVWHPGLLHKLRSYGISGKIFDTIKSFLSDRKLRVVLDGQHSSTYVVTSGVPQGSILGPILFLLFINDLPDHIMSKVAIFADDTSIYSCADKKLDEADRITAANEVTSDLAKVSSWGKDWLVNFNTKKTHLLSVNNYKNTHDAPISMDENNLTEDESIRLLGLSISSNLSWSDYISSIAKSSSRKVGSLFRARRSLSPEAILHLYKATIRPCMEYCCHLWAGAPANSLSLLDKVQNRVCNLIGPQLAAKLQPLSHRRNVASLSLFYKYFNKKCSTELSSLVPRLRPRVRTTRQSSNAHPYTVQIPKSTKSLYASSFFPRTSNLWNLLPADIFPDSYDMDKFKSSVNRHLISSL